MHQGQVSAPPSRRQKVLLAAAGAGIGLLAGAFAGAFTIVLLAAVAWLFVFGDDPWPGWSAIAIAGIGYAVTLAATVTGGIVGWRHA
jgi:hypothetical protein